jgi:hypothetical protein
VWYKHRDNLFMPAGAELLSMLLVRAFNTALEVIYFGLIVFFMVGYTRTAGGYSRGWVDVSGLLGFSAKAAVPC